MADKVKKYCEGIDCSWCNEKEPCIYKIANELEEKLQAKEQECEALKVRCKSLEEISGRLQEQNHNLTLENEKLKVYKSIAPLNVKKLVQTFTTIKEIAEHCYDPVDKENDGFWTILQKISEVENE